MTRINPIFNSFSSGELSPRLYARADTDRYKSGVKRLTNFIPLPHGPVVKRAGTGYVAHARNANTAARLIPFETAGNAFVLELGDLYMRFYVNGARIMNGAAPVEVATPWGAADIAGVQFAQTDAALYLVHPSTAPRKLTRTNDTTWTLASPTFTAAAWGTSYPRAVTLFQQRLWLGGSAANPQTFWGSKTGSHEDFTGGPNDADAVSFSIASDTAEHIQWMLGARTLMIGCSNGEFVVNGKPITPTQFDIIRQTGYGSASAPQPDMVGNEVLFVQRGGTKLRNMVWRYERDAHTSSEASMIAEHIAARGIVDQTATRLPDSILWEVLSDGRVAVVAYQGEEDASGWSVFETDGRVESVCGITVGSRSELWLVVRRTINNATVRYIERLDLSGIEAVHMDCHGTYTGAATATLTGLGHLEGKIVRVMANGALHRDLTVTAGAITLDAPATTVQVGLAYTATLETLPIEGGNPAGTALGRVKRWNEVFVHLWQSAMPKIAADRPPVRHVSTPMGTVEPLLSELVRVSNLGFDRQGSVTVEQDLPMPCMVLGVFGTVAVHD